jgi:hypothetical protein
MKKVIIATMVRDVNHKIPQIIQKIERTGQLFLDYVVLIVENDSEDGTRASLLEWAKKNPRVKVLGCGVNVQECKLPKAPKTVGHGIERPRIQKMVDLRNIYLDEIKNEYSGVSGGTPEYEYVIMWDTDLIGSVYLDGIANSVGILSEQPDIDTICANGIYRWGLFTIFYDTYALIHKGEKFHVRDKMKHDIRKGLWEARYNRGDPIVEVDSCFSGFAIYRTECLLDQDVKYEMTSDPTNVLCEHHTICSKIKGKKMLNPSMINYVLLND